MAERVRRGELAAVRSATIRRCCAAPPWGPWAFDAAKSGAGLFDLLIHYAGMCLDRFGAPRARWATGDEDMPHGIDTILAQLAYPNIGFVSGSAGWRHLDRYLFPMKYRLVAAAGERRGSADTAGGPLGLRH